MPLEQIILEEMRAMEGRAIDLNQAQLQEGKRADGGDMPMYKNPAYARRKGKDRWDLKLTGGLYQGMYADFNEKYMEMDSKDDVARVIDEHPDSDAFYGLDEESKEIFSRELNQRLIIRIYNAL